MKKAFPIILLLAFLALLLFGVTTALSLPRLVATGMYEQKFGVRNGSASAANVNLSIYSGLQREKCTFASGDGQLLTGYRYWHNGVETRAALVLVHGYGGGHTGYLPVIDYFAGNGYLVFAYDGTGNSESEGDSVRGLPQAIVDLDYALQYVKGSSSFDGLPLLLWGHSQGAYAVGSVLPLHPDVKAAVMSSGFNHAQDMLKVEGQKLMGDGIDLLLPALDKLEEQKFGKYADMNCLDGMAATEAGIMLLHSADDETVDIATSFDRYKAEFGDDSRFTFLSFEDRGHSCYLHTVDASSLNTPFGTPMGGFPGGGFTNVIQITTLDEDLMDQMLTFYEHYLTDTVS